MSFASALQHTSIPFTGGPVVGPHVFSYIAKHTADPALRQSAEIARQEAHEHALHKLDFSLAREALRKKGGVGEQLRLFQGDGEIADFKIYDAQGASRATFSDEYLKRAKGEPSNADPAVNDAYDQIQNSLYFYLKELGLNSIDAKGMAIKAAVHIGRLYNNAFYVDGTINFGDGDGKIFKDFQKDLTVVAHELGHGIVDMVLGGLVYFSQSGALNESIADIMGISALQFVLKELATPEAHWLLGQTAMVPYKNPETGEMVYPALRSLSAPGTAYVKHPKMGGASDPQPAHMKNYYRGSADNQGVHINSSIPNHAFYTAVTQIKERQTLLKVWLEGAQRAIKKHGSRVGFKAFAEETLAVAEELFANRPEIKQAVFSGWEKVGVLGAGAVEIEPIFSFADSRMVRMFGFDVDEALDLELRLSQIEWRKFPEVQKAQLGFEYTPEGGQRLIALLLVDDVTAISVNKLQRELEARGIGNNMARFVKPDSIDDRMGRA